MTLPAGFLLAVATGLCLLAGFPRTNLWPLPWAALVPLFFVYRGSSLRRSLAMTGVAGFIFFACLLWWASLFGYAPWILLSVMQTAFLMILCVVAQPLFCQDIPVARLLLVPAIWTAVEWVRSLGTFGFTWGQLAQSQVPFLEFAQLGSVTGPWGLSYVILATNVALFEICASLPGHRRKALVRATVVIATVAVISVWGFLSTIIVEHGENSVRVAAIQANVDQDVKQNASWDEHSRRTMAAYGGMTLEALQEGPGLIVWPETAIPGYFAGHGDYRQIVEAAAQAGNAYVLVGGSDVAPPLHLRMREYNGAYLFSPDGKLSGKYLKTHLVPFGEFVPGRGLALLERYNIRNYDIAPGEGHYPLQTDFGKLGILICFESTFPSIARTLTLRGANVLVVMTNDAWFKRTAAAEQHHAMAILRAIENRRCVVRSAATGISSVITSQGIVHSSAGIYTAKVVTGFVTPLKSRTVYTRFGDWFAYISVAGSLVALFLRRRNRQ